MKKILAVLIALMIAALPAMAMAENADWLQEALDAGRELTVKVSSRNADEASKPQSDINTTLKVQYNPSLVSFAAALGDKSLTDFEVFGDDDGALYIKSNLLGKTIAFTEEELAMMAESVITAIQNSGLIDAIKADAARERAEELEFEAEFADMAASLDLTPLLLTILDLRDNITIMDVEDYELNVERLAPEEGEVTVKEEDIEAPKPEEEAIDEDVEASHAETDAEEAAEAAEDVEKLDDSKTIAMYAVLTLTQDDAQRLLNAVMETIGSNASLYAMLGQIIDPVTEIQENFIDRMSEDLNVVVGLSADGEPEYASATVALDQADGNIESYMIEMSKDAQDDVRGMIFTVKVSDETSEDWKDVCSIGGYASDERAAGHFILTPDAESEFKMSIIAEYPAATETEATMNAEIKLEVAENGETDALALDIAADLEKTEADVEGEIVIALNRINGEEAIELGATVIDVSTGEPETFVTDDAVFPIELDEDEQLSLLSEIADSFANALTEIVNTVSGTAAE